MQTDYRDSELQQLFCVCEEMLDLARRGEWSRVAELDNHRTSLLTSFFTDNGLQDADMRQAIGALVGFNEELVLIATSAREAVGGQLHKLQQGRRAVNAYTSLV